MGDNRPIGNENWTFFQAFLKSPLVVASAVPSSPFLKQRILEAADASSAEFIVELGAGTGGTTRSLLEAMPTGARLLAIERTADFLQTLEHIDDERFELVHGCASSIDSELERLGHPTADTVVSGIPFSTMPRQLCHRIIGAIDRALRPGGRFVAYQWSDKVADYARPVLGEPMIRHELRNIPPMRVFTFHKADLAAGATA